MSTRDPLASLFDEGVDGAAPAGPAAPASDAVKAPDTDEAMEALEPGAVDAPNAAAGDAEGASAAVEGSLGGTWLTPEGMAARRWPEDVPQVPELRERLASLEPRDAVNAFLERFCAELSEDHRVLVQMGPDVPDELRPVHDALVVRARLALASSRKPERLYDVSDAGVEALLGESDAALAALKVPEGASEQARESLAELRGALARAAVELTELASSVAKARAAQSAEKNVAKRYERVTKMVSTESGGAPAAARRQRMLVIAFAVVFAVTAAFHAYRFLRRPVPVGMNAPPMGTHGLDAPKASFFQVTDRSKAKDPAIRKAVEEHAQAEGKQLFEAAPGQFVLLPQMPESSPPAPEVPHAP